LLVYSHTHDPAYVIDGLVDVFKDYKAAGVPTVSAHLDRWLWLKRVEDVGREATWFTEFIFMADASPEAAELYDSLGLNWYYLRPAVVERDCYMAEPDHDRFPHEIIFTGSRGYHPEYPFRPELVDWLHKTYGDRFGHYGNDGIRVLRQHDLNVALASAKVVVGDSCFGGRPNYVSDRYYETRGRGGFLTHPWVEGVDTTGVAHYKPRDWGSLKKTIGYWLEHDIEREEQRRTGFEWVKNNETYTHRSAQIIETVFGV
jgi:spore maturation protein CgeB